VSSHCVILYNILLLVLIVSVTLSTTKTVSVYWKSTELGNYDIGYGYPLIITSTSCYNYLSMYIGTYTNGVYTNYYYTYTRKTFNYFYWSPTSTIFYSLSEGYLAILSAYTILSAIINTYYPSYIETYLYTDYVTFTNTISLLNISTDIQYSTITRMIAPSPSILSKDKCTCVFSLCNRLDLVLLTINNIV
jgi:hypothetical protein